MQKRALLRAILDRHGRTFSQELGIRVERNTPSPLFRLLCFALVSSARINHRIALSAARALAQQGWTTPRKLLQSTWRQRTDVLNHAGYARYDESTSRMLADTAEHLLEEYGGDLRRLRAVAGQDPQEERRLLKVCKGIGEVGVDIFFREVQLVWEEVFPFADKVALRAAGRLGLGGDAAALRRWVDGSREFVLLMDGLVRVELEGAYAELGVATGGKEAA